MTEIQRDVLLLPCTRPAMKKGVPMEGYYINAFGTTLIGMYTTPLLWVLAFPIHAGMRVLANKNPGFFREWRVWLQTRASVVGGTLWALATHEPKTAQEVISSV